MTSHKRCSICKQTLYLSMFGARKGRPGKYRSACNTCRVSTARDQRQPGYVPPVKPTKAERFWAKAQCGSPDVCWLWQHSVSPNGYGQFDHMGAHRVAWELHNGRIPDGLVVRHTCDTPPCVNPNHLLLGTAKDNVHDSISRGRFTVGDRNGSRRSPERLSRGDSHWARKYPEKVLRGEENPNAKLTTEKVSLIAAGLQAGVSQSSLAAEFNVSKRSVTFIAQGKTWRHVMGPLRMVAVTYLQGSSISAVEVPSVPEELSPPPRQLEEAMEAIQAPPEVAKKPARRKASEETVWAGEKKD